MAAYLRIEPSSYRKMHVCINSSYLSFSWTFQDVTTMEQQMQRPVPEIQANVCRIPLEFRYLPAQFAFGRARDCWLFGSWAGDARGRRGRRRRARKQGSSDSNVQHYKSVSGVQRPDPPEFLIFTVMRTKERGQCRWKTEREVQGKRRSRGSRSKKKNSACSPSFETKTRQKKVQSCPEKFIPFVRVSTAKPAVDQLPATLFIKICSND